MTYLFDLLKIAALALMITGDGIGLPGHLRRSFRIETGTGHGDRALVVAVLTMTFAPLVYHGLELARCLGEIA